MRQRIFSSWTFLSLFALPWIPSFSGVPDLALVARQDFQVRGEAGFLEAGAWYTFSKKDLPPGKIGLEDPLRRVVFGSQVILGFEGLDPRARYDLVLTFLSDAHRVEKVLAGGLVLSPRLVLEKGKVLRKRWTLPPGSYGRGNLEIRILRVEGPNAVLSRLEIFSSNPARLRPRKVPDFSSPRLSPTPREIPGLSPLRLSLDGTWLFHPAPGKEASSGRGGPEGGWRPIQVPGEWTMQGFHVKPGNAAGYRRSFRLPPSWEGKRIKLRCNGVYSLARVYLNGRFAGSHEGGFTPFELDVTSLVKPGKNRIYLEVTNESLQDTLSSGTQYAAHQLGGITRSIFLFPLPSVNFASFHAYPSFKADGASARLKVKVRIASEGLHPGKKMRILLRLRGPLPGRRILLESRFLLPVPSRGKCLERSFLLDVAKPRKWDPEHPNLYLLEGGLLGEGGLLERVSRKIGFREVVVRGNRLYVNGIPVKLRGVDRHEIDPLRGRSLVRGEWKRDVLLFKKANVNYIRTSHYPPDEAFLEACDEAGLFVEEEAPFCWVGHPTATIWGKWDPFAPNFLPHLVRPVLEMIERDASHPSVIIWSLANESLWTLNFARVFHAARERDPSRPFSFHDQCWGRFNNLGSRTQIANVHYPGPKGPERAAAVGRPVLFGEYCHVPVYDRRELAADPGIRVLWGKGFHRMWEKILAVPACLGGAIWAGIDDVFLLPSGRLCGYGPWGIVDVWRRPKPEYWEVKKTYSPVKILTKRIEPGAGPFSLSVLNRHLFSDLSECSFRWRDSRGGSGVAKTSAPPGGKARLIVDPGRALRQGDFLLIRVYGPGGIMEDVYRIPVGDPAPGAPPGAGEDGGAPLRLSRREGRIVVSGEGFRVSVNASSGLLEECRKGGRPVLEGGPFLMILPLTGGPCRPNFKKDIQPLNDILRGWKAESVTASKAGRAVTLRVAGRFPTARGTFSYTIHPGGKLRVGYDFEIEKDVNPRQWGVVFRLPGGCRTLSWRRKTRWSWYPPDHIGRPAGTARALPPGGPRDPWSRTPPEGPWFLDGGPSGTRDFRSTKKDVYWAALRAVGGEGLLVKGEAVRSVRAWLQGGKPFLLVARFTTMGREGFFGGHVARERRPLHRGDHVRDEFDLVLLGPGR